ncbi:acetate/propionate family kinase [Macellibacteroides fermentans]|jgi:acetate kinase|uniref:acetate/propionate family kinase n=1 Tax=Macellibacteroides fermentans TaxID=879969 RepID=UPI00082D68CA|nr:acetate kinase [Macellibacteroides sp. HH-ZS]HML72318.1 acetate kinase [Macellibacteroides fermentans]
MIILVLNCGSSSVKYKLFDMSKQEVMAQGGVEKLGLPGSFLKFTLPSGEKVVLEKELPEHNVAIQFILSILTDNKYGCIKSLNEIDAVGHRVVHGGEKFSSSVRITNEVIGKVVECIDLAPLHNPPNLKGIRAMDAIIPGIPQVAVFDTAFHQTMPDYAYMYGLPYSLYKKYGIRRYGFHGTSHRFVSQRACDVLGVPFEKQRIITAHIGNGGSITAIKDGKSIDTTMGLTPVEGLLMGTRCGDVDAGALSFIMDKEGLNAAGLSDLINKQSGVMGLSSISSDMREIEAAIEDGDKKAILTMNVYNYRIKKYIGAYAAALGGLDLLIFTGGVGENQWSTRTAVCREMEFMGIKLDEAKNDHMRGKEMVISTPDSKVTVMVVPTDEELTIAKDTLEILSKE